MHVGFFLLVCAHAHTGWLVGWFFFLFFFFLAKVNDLDAQRVGNKCILHTLYKCKEELLTPKW